jgi:malonyl-CoA decarboxylase
MSDSVAPLIDKKAIPLASDQFKVAVFYSISNCQPGLRNVSLGNFLIKRVADELKRELPQLKTFCTLSPIPGLTRWLSDLRHFDDIPGLKPAQVERARQSLALLHKLGGDDLAGLTQAATLQTMAKGAHQALWHLAAVYLVLLSPTPAGDPVARFHLDNGARLERLNANADLSSKGLRQSAGLMVNYLYDLSRIESCHHRFIQGRVVHSRALSALL